MAALRFQHSNQNMEIIKTNSLNFTNDKENMAENLLNPDTWVDAYADYLFNYAIGRINDSEIAKKVS